MEGKHPGVSAVLDGEIVIALMHDNEKASSMLKVSGSQDQKVGRSTISVRPVVGCEYGSVYQINKRKLERVAPGAHAALFENFTNGGEEDSEEDMGNKEGEALLGDNSGYMDSNTAQKLKDEDILRLKSQGTSGEEIIKTLIQNSDTWNSKSEFSQMKWLKRKQKKYMPSLRVMKSTPSSLCEVYHNKSREKLYSMRGDSLGVILSEAGIHPGQRLLVFDTALGIIAGSAAYRMRGSGQIMAVYQGQQPHFQLVRALNIDDESAKIIQPIPSNEIVPAAKFVEKYGFLDFESEEPLLRPVEDINNSNGNNSNGSSTKKNAYLSDADEKTAPYHASGRHTKDIMRVRRLLREGAESLIIATGCHPLPILKEALPLLAPSSPFVIFCEFSEPLVECFNYLFLSELGLRLNMTETLLREFQTLPGRVHPHMKGSGSGGFLLYGTYVGGASLHQKHMQDKAAAASANTNADANTSTTAAADAAADASRHEAPSSESEPSTKRFKSA